MKFLIKLSLFTLPIMLCIFILVSFMGNTKDSINIPNNVIEWLNSFKGDFSSVLSHLENIVSTFQNNISITLPGWLSNIPFIGSLAGDISVIMVKFYSVSISVIYTLVEFIKYVINTIIWIITLPGYIL